MDYKDKLTEVWLKELKVLEELEVVSDNYRIQQERVTAIERQLTELEKSDMENSEKVMSRETNEQLKREEMEMTRKENKKHRTAEYVKLAGYGLALGFMTILSLGYEKENIPSFQVTKEAFREGLSGIRIFK